MALGSASLSMLLLIAWPVSFEAARQRITGLVTPKAAWVLVLGVSMVASRYLAAHVLHSFEQQPPPQSVELEDLPVHLTQAFTDQGRSIALFRFKIHSTEAEVQQFIDSHEKDRSQIIRLQEPNSAANCHGWVFTAGAYGIRDAEIASILLDNGYAAASDPQEGDSAVYFHADRITHSGIVRLADKHAPILIESKWGPLGVYLHAAEQQPFGGACKFLRSARPDHLLALQRSNSAGEPVLQTLADEQAAE